MKRLEAVVIGSEFIGTTHVEALRRVPGVDVVALVDIVDPVQKAEELDVPNGFSDYREMIKAVEPDYIHIYAPNHAHKEITLCTSKHEIHVICEKSMARDAGETKEMLEAAKRSNLVHAINLHNRFYPASHQLRNTALDEALGRIYGIHGAYLQDCSSQESGFDWRVLFARGGSTRVISDIGSHWTDLAEYIIGSKIKKVFTEFQTNLPVRKMSLAGNLKDIAMDIEDTSYATVRFENGAVGSAVFSQAYQGKKNQTTIRISGSGISTEQDSEAIGNLKLGYQNEPNRLLTKDRGLTHPDTAPIVAYPDGHAEGFPDVFKQSFIAVYEVIRGVKPINPYVDFEDRLHRVQALNKVFEGAETDCWTSVNQRREETVRMKVGIVADIMQGKPLAKALDYFRDIGIQTTEPGCDGCTGKSHINPVVLLGDKEKMDGFKRTIAGSGLIISVLFRHGNPIHPNQGVAVAHDGDMWDAVHLCKELGPDTITYFPGCVGGCPDSKSPNWVTCPWPDDYPKILDYQWNEVLIPYRREFAAFVKENGVAKIALELHPGFMIYDSETLKRLRGAVGREIGVNFDPSHLLQQGVDPVSVIRELKDATCHVHARDVKAGSINTAINGVLDTKHYNDKINCSWVFRTIGYGNDTAYWKDIFSTLRTIGYDGVVSIEHENNLANRFGGLGKAVRIVKESLIMEDKTGMWWT